MRLPDRSGFWRQMPLLAGLLLCGGSALSALTMSVDEPIYEGILYGALVAGILTSAFGLKRGRLFALPGALVMLAAFSLFALRFVNLPVVYLLYPSEVLAHEDLVLAAMVGWLLVAFSFWQSSRANLIFLIVSGLPIFSLVGTINLNVEMRFAFAVFVLAAVFCWSYEQFLDMDDRLVASGQPRTANWTEMVRGHVSLAMLVGLLTFGIGSLVGTGAYRISPNVYARMAREIYGWNSPWNNREIFNSFTHEFSVGTGPVRLLPLPVLEVRAHHGALWRGVAYNYYDGRGWKRTLRAYTADMNYDGSQYAAPANYIISPVQGQINQQDVTVLGPVGIVFASAQPERLILRGGTINPYGSNVPAVDAYGCISGTENEASREYTVFSREPVYNADAFRRADTDYGAHIPRAYMNVPATTQAELAPTVRQLTAGLTNPYDKVIALQEFLQEQCLYSLDAPAVPPRADVVAHFVLSSRRGACDLFATSLAVMARMAGVPARVATGYHTGEFDQDKQAFVVKGTDAHAWTEVYFPGHGWVAFDPQAEDQVTDLSLAELFEKGHWRWLFGDIFRQAAWVIGLIMIALIAMAAIVDPLGLARQAFAPRLRTPLQRLSSEYRAFYQSMLRRSGVQPNPALTPREAVHAAIAALHAQGLDRRILLDANERFYNLRYTAEASEAQIEAMRRNLRKLRKKLSKRQK